MSSVSSRFMNAVTNFRNPERPDGNAHPAKRLVAEVGYAVTFGVSVVETIVSLFAKALSSMLPLSEKNHKAMSNWTLSSCSTAGYSLAYFFILNPCSNHITPVNG